MMVSSDERSSVNILEQASESLVTPKNKAALFFQLSRRKPIPPTSSCFTAAFSPWIPVTRSPRQSHYDATRPFSAGAAFVLANSTFRLRRPRAPRDTRGHAHRRIGQDCVPTGQLHPVPGHREPP